MNDAAEGAQAHMISLPAALALAAVVLCAQPARAVDSPEAAETAQEPPGVWAEPDESIPKSGEPSQASGDQIPDAGESSPAPGDQNQKLTQGSGNPAGETVKPAQAPNDQAQESAKTGQQPGEPAPETAGPPQESDGAAQSTDEQAEGVIVLPPGSGKPIKEPVQSLSDIRTAKKPHRFKGIFIDVSFGGSPVTEIDRAPNGPSEKLSGNQFGAHIGLMLDNTLGLRFGFRRSVGELTFIDFGLARAERDRVGFYPYVFTGLSYVSSGDLGIHLDFGAGYRFVSGFEIKLGINSHLYSLDSDSASERERVGDDVELAACLLRNDCLAESASRETNYAYGFAFSLGYQF